MLSSDSTYESRGQVFRGGASIAAGMSFLVGGLALAAGAEPFQAGFWALVSFFVLGMLAFFAELIVGPALERVALQREQERAEFLRENTPSGGAAVPNALALTGGEGAPPFLPVGPHGVRFPGGALPSAAGRALDIRLPEEGMSSYPVSAPAVPAAPVPAVRPSTPAALAAPAAPDDEFQDLAALLREASRAGQPASQGSPASPASPSQS